MLHKTDEARIAWSVLKVKARIDKSCEVFDIQVQDLYIFFIIGRCIYTLELLVSSFDGFIGMKSKLFDIC